MHHIHFTATDSTNSQARRLAAEHPGERLLVTAAVQTAGRGRQGRVWESPRGGAWLSFVWPTRQPPRAYAAASLAAAAAVRRALAEAAPEVAPELRIKWPNDLLLSDRKVAGILCEQIPATPPASGLLIIGVGVNVEFDLALLPPDLRHPPTTLRAAAGRSIAVDAVANEVARRLAEAMTQFESEGLSPSLLAELTASLANVGTVRTWQSAGGDATGRVLGLDDAGRLLLEGPAGVTACETGELSP
jgi:BirA family transcriptional regulator, biotin operon repressor / biotin---[acetyl-CoA-carboxylase] ligase